MEHPTQHHPSRYRDQRIVYPVVSRRARGVSIGVNLSPSMACNFGCLYCQVRVDRVGGKDDLPGISPYVERDRLEDELRTTVAAVVSGKLFGEPAFAKTAPDRRALKDFAFSGDGEPTLSPQFGESVDILAKVRREENLDAVKLVLITNATMLGEKKIATACDHLVENHGEIWGKLDAGSSEVYQRINRSPVPYETVLANLLFAAKHWPLAIQTMFFMQNNLSPTREEVDDYTGRIGGILDAGGAIDRLQLYTIARVPFEGGLAPLPNEMLDQFAETLRLRTGLAVEVFYSR